MVTLTVTKRSIAGATGDVIGGGIDCGNTCSITVPAGTTVALTSSAPTFQSFALDCPGCTYVFANTISVEMRADRSVRASFRPPINYVFVTSTARAANMGGLAGADAICASHAAAAGLPGTYVAWLSTSSVDAISRLGTARGWMRTDGRPVADTPASLINWPSLLYPASLDEIGNDAALQPATSGGGLNSAWSGTDEAGKALTDGTLCSDWTTNETSQYGRIGFPGSSTDWSWANSILSCRAVALLYCFEITHHNPVSVSPAPQGARIAFLSSPFRMGGGLAGADARCASDAAAAGLPGNFKALLADVGKPPFDPARFDASRSPWYRVDGVQIVHQASDFAHPHGPELLAPIAVTADGHTIVGGGVSWMGFGGGDGDLTLPGTILTTCNGWTSIGGRVVVADWRMVSMYWGPTGECDEALPLECLQQ